MRKFLKWAGIVLLSLIVIIVLASLIMANTANKKMTHKYEVNLASVAVRSDSAALVRGAVIASSLCITCHGGDYAGTEFFNEPGIGIIPASNITPAGKTKNYSTDDWVRTIRYGVKPDGTGVFIMPSESFNYLSDDDLGSLIGYMKTVPAADKTWPDPDLTYLSKVLATMGAFGNLYPADIIDLTDNKSRTAPPFGATVAFGEYTVNFHGCKTCHGQTLNGAKSPDPVSPPGSNISMGGNFGKWTEEQFKKTLRTGTTPEGKNLDPEFMPWPAIGTMTEDEMKAVYLYIRSLPALPDAEI